MWEVLACAEEEELTMLVIPALPIQGFAYDRIRSST